MRPTAPIASTQWSENGSMNASQALVEAHRCLGCHEAPCTQACPVHIDVPGFIRRIAQGNLAGANQLLVERNPLAAVCGLICPTEDLCEGACVLPRLGQMAVRIGDLQYFAADQFPRTEEIFEQPPSKRIAVVGGGPSGLGCAVALRRLGCDVHLFDRSATLGGLVGKVIPAYRLIPNAMQREIVRLQQHGIKFHFSTDVTPRMIDLFAREYDAVFLGIGLSRLADSEFTGVNLSGLRQAMELLDEARLFAAHRGPKPEVGGTVVVVGGGNVALDAAVIAKTSGAERVIVLYRRTLEEMPAWRSEYLDAAEQGIEFRWLSTIKSFESRDGRIIAVEVQPMRRVEPQPGQRRGVEPDLSAPAYRLPCDTVLLALGQQLDLSWVEDAGIAANHRGVLEVNPKNYQTNRRGVFAGGEAAIGGSTAVACIADGMAAGRSIYNWLMEQEADNDGS